MGAADPAPGRIAALDIGEAWTGVAVSDPGASIANPLETIPAPDLTSYLQSLVTEQGVSEVLVGVPKTLRGESGHQARRVLEKLDELKMLFPDVCFVEWDERLTTRVAESRASDRRQDRRQDRRRGKNRGNRGGSPGRGRLDHLAAAEMLREYLMARSRTR